MNKYNWKIDVDKVKDLYNSGLSCSEVGKVLGVTRQSIWQKMKNANIPMRTKKLLPYIIYDNKKWTISKTTGYYRLTNSRKVHVSLHRYVWEKEIGRIPLGFDIHHINGDKTNNNIYNLECLSKAEHTSKYSPHHNQYKNNKTKHLYEQNRTDYD